MKLERGYSRDGYGQDGNVMKEEANAEGGHGDRHESTAYKASIPDEVDGLQSVWVYTFWQDLWVLTTNFNNATGGD